jgi:surfactin family lipopeptide synthetase A
MQTPPQVNVHEGASSVAPRTPTEQTLLDIWSDVLQVEHIGVYDDFLELGGDSLAAMRCQNRIRTAFQVEVPIETFLAGAVADIATIASEIDRSRSGGEHGAHAD